MGIGNGPRKAQAQPDPALGAALVASVEPFEDMIQVWFADERRVLAHERQ